VTEGEEGLFRDTKVRWWLTLQVASFVGWFSLASAMTVAGVDFLLIILAMVVVALGVTVLIDPRRAWWGDGPIRVMTDPGSRRRYRRMMMSWLLIALITSFLVLTLSVATGFIQPAGE
jgi:hypothetical protein